jgi:16S rRNA (uracil1498-N3)-methyltransferase
MEISLCDGEGEEWRAEVAAVAPGEVRAALLEPLTAPVEPPIELTVLQAVSRDESFEAALDQLTALGVSVVIPVLVERTATGRAPDARRLARWRRIARESSKLSWRRKVPKVEDPLPLAEAAAHDPARARGLLLDTGAPPGSLNELLRGPAPAAVLLAVGPEGGFSPAERTALIAAGFAPVSLGPRVLRTEHAGAAAAVLVLAAWGDAG